MENYPLKGKRVAVLAETEYIYKEIQFYKKCVAELGGELDLLTYLWEKPKMRFVNDVNSPDFPCTGIHELIVRKCVKKVSRSNCNIVICATNYVAVRLREIPPLGSLSNVKKV